MSMNDDIIKNILLAKLIESRLPNWVHMISRDYERAETLSVSILKGSVVFMADLGCRPIPRSSIDFMVVSSYGGKYHHQQPTRSSLT